MDGNLENNNQAINNLKGKVIGIPQVDPTLEKEGYAAESKTTGELIKARVKTEDIIDNLLSDDTDKPLSARQGKVLSEQLKDINLSDAGAVNYDNTESGLVATNMQSALDEVADISKNAVSKNGGDMINGPVKVQNADNGYGSLNKNNTATEDNGTQVVDTSKDGKTASVDVSALLGLFTYTDPDGNVRKVHHEGSKPFVEYKGNGSASPRKISSGGFGRLILLYCSTHLSFVTPKGAWVIDLSTGTGSWIGGDKVYCSEGNLNTETANAAFNASGVTYYGQVV